jgi:DNA-directed RNA polymerase specialized sigma24 family protein
MSFTSNHGVDSAVLEKEFASDEIRLTTGFFASRYARHCKVDYDTAYSDFHSHAWERLKHYNPVLGTSVRTFISACLKNYLFTLRRRHSKVSRTVQLRGDLHRSESIAVDRGEDTSELVDRNSVSQLRSVCDGEAVRLLSKILSPKQKIVFELRFIYSVPFKEIGRRLDLDFPKPMASKPATSWNRAISLHNRAVAKVIHYFGRERVIELLQGGHE